MRAKADSIRPARPALNVVKLPQRPRPASDAEQGAKLLRKLAAEIDGDSSVRGVMAIVDRSTSSGDDISIEPSGILRRSRERACWVVSRVLHNMLDIRD